VPVKGPVFSPPANRVELIEGVREQGFEGIVAKRRDSAYKPGQRSAVWQKMRVLQRRDFVFGGYTPAGRNFDAILIGDYESGSLRYVANVHGGFTPALRASVFKKFDGLETTTCRSRTCRTAAWSLGRRTKGRGDGEMPLAETAWPRRSSLE
jgi:ATP-dependent DNA ligase